MFECYLFIDCAKASMWPIGDIGGTSRRPMLGVLREGEEFSWSFLLENVKRKDGRQAW
jgi:hypothetical protein